MGLKDIEVNCDNTLVPSTLAISMNIFTSLVMVQKVSTLKI